LCDAIFADGCKSHSSVQESILAMRNFIGCDCVWFLMPDIDLIPIMSHQDFCQYPTSVQICSQFAPSIFLFRHLAPNSGFPVARPRLCLFDPVECLTRRTFPNVPRPLPLSLALALFQDFSPHSLSENEQKNDQ
jgi:hypothetical protein